MNSYDVLAMTYIILTHEYESVKLLKGNKELDGFEYKATIFHRNALLDGNRWTAVCERTGINSRLSLAEDRTSPFISFARLLLTSAKSFLFHFAALRGWREFRLVYESHHR